MRPNFGVPDCLVLLVLLPCLNLADSLGKKGANADDTPRKRASMLIPPKANGTNGTTAAETPAVAPETTAATAEPAAAVESATDKVNGNGVTNGNGVAAEPATATA